MPYWRPPFLKNETDVLKLALMATRFGRLPSEIVGLPDSLAALDFNHACFQRLHLYEVEEMETKLRLNSLGHLTAINGKVLEFDSASSEGAEEW